MKLFKKNENKKTTKLPMTGKVKKGFRYYCMAVMAMTFVLGTSVTAFAANDPIQVVNNLSDFIFGLVRAVGMIMLGFGRSEERRVGKECTSWCRSRWSPYH